MGLVQESDKTFPRPGSVLCREVLQNILMTPAKLKRHFETKHSEIKRLPLSFFQSIFKKKPVFKENLFIQFSYLKLNLTFGFHKSESEAHIIGKGRGNFIYLFGCKDVKRGS